MARPSKQKLANRKRLRDPSTGKIVSSISNVQKEESTTLSEAIPEDDQLLEDWELWENDTTEIVSSNNHNSGILALLSDDGSSSKRPRNGHYSKNSESTLYRRRKEAKLIKQNGRLENFGFGRIDVAVNEEKQQRFPHTQQELARMKACFSELFKYTEPVMNLDNEGSEVRSYEYTRYCAIKYYFERRLGGENKGTASKATAAFFWEKSSKYYRPNAIVAWVKEFLENHQLSKHKQGVHVKRWSFLSDNDIKAQIMDFIAKTKPAERTLDLFADHINKEIIPSSLGVPGKISKTTLRSYLEEWGYSYRPNQKAIFFDGHEREDVVSYRNQWSKRMLEYMERSEFYEGEMLEEVLEPVLDSDKKKIVFVTHDECTFYANDGKKNFWLEKEENYIRKKSQGSSLMISEFQCPCHGTMRIEGGRSSRKVFKAGTGRDGWWTIKDMIQQLKEDAIPLFDQLHPNCTAVFLFDNSSNHSAYADDALVATRMTLNEREWGTEEKYQFRDTEIKLTNGRILKQNFFYQKQIEKKTSRGGLKHYKVRYFKGKC